MHATNDPTAAIGSRLTAVMFDAAMLGLASEGLTPDQARAVMAGRMPRFLADLDTAAAPLAEATRTTLEG